MILNKILFAVAVTMWIALAALIYLPLVFDKLGDKCQERDDIGTAKPWYAKTIGIVLYIEAFCVLILALRVNDLTE